MAAEASVEIATADMEINLKNKQEASLKGTVFNLYNRTEKRTENVM